MLEAWRLHLPLGDVLLWTPLARLERIVIAPLAVLAFASSRNGFSRRIQRVRWNGVLAVLIVIYWVALYGWYWGSLIPKQYG